MDASPSVWLLISVLLLVLVIAAAVAHIVEWHLYTTARAERDRLRADLLAMTVDRDGWRSVGERALIVARMGQRVTTRAARVVRATETLDS